MVPPLLRRMRSGSNTTTQQESGSGWTPVKLQNRLQNRTSTEKKVMLCVWWNSKGLVYFEVLDSGQTVTANLYQGQLDRVDQALRRQGVDTASTKFLHDNARPHVAKITQQKIEEMGWEVLPHPPYSPDLAPSDYHLFRSMHHSLAEKKFKNRDEVQIWVSNFFESQPVEFFKKGIHSLRVIDADGEYLLD
ncbi:unnamed protein product, partial [Mesorhabditis belari]|uniref:Transposase n=1 Tax=Mesorhabditis belari TaxID=2138241 RepID=A0AAF3JA13_9BILA